jgi:hypothetical protein
MIFQYEFVDFFTFHFAGLGELEAEEGVGGCGAGGGLRHCGARGPLQRQRIGLRGGGRRGR